MAEDIRERTQEFLERYKIEILATLAAVIGSVAIAALVVAALDTDPHTGTLNNWGKNEITCGTNDCSQGDSDRNSQDFVFSNH